MDEQMQKIEAFEQAQIDARNPKLRQTLRTRKTAVRLTEEEYEDWKRIKVSLPELIATGIRFHKKNEARQKKLCEAVQAFLTTAPDKTMVRDFMHAILLQTPLKPTLEEIEETITRMERESSLLVLYRLFR